MPKNGNEYDRVGEFRFREVTIDLTSEEGKALDKFLSESDW